MPAAAARLALGSALAAASCSAIGVTPAPRHLEAGSSLRCTQSYWLPAADVVAAAGATGVALWQGHETDEAIDEAHARGEYDAFDGLALAMPYLLGALVAVPLAVSGARGLKRVRDCRDAREWIRTTSAPPGAGRPGRPCVPVRGGGGQCAPHLTCQAGMCALSAPIVRVPAPTRGSSREACAMPLARLDATADAQQWHLRWAALEDRCKELLRVSCASSTRPACARLSR
ncbi:MAG TPA: hypothetical protein VFU21_33155 [Kofleriaceae bacterium]|nr:hypothetical protein [Kofleriaceae bacterium]